MVKAKKGALSKDKTTVVEAPTRKNKQKKVGGGKGEENVKSFDDFLETLLDDDSSDSDGDEPSDSGDGMTMEVEAVNGFMSNGNAGEENGEGSESDGDVEEGDDEDDEEDDDEEDDDVLEAEGFENGGDDEEDLELEEEVPMVEEDDDQNSEDGDEETAKEHKNTLKRLQETDPDFFQYLKQNDAGLLKFDDSEDDSDESGDDEDQEDPIHKPPEDLEEASDSEAEEERVEREAQNDSLSVDQFIRKGIVNLHVIADWETKLSTTRDLAVFVNVVEAFECAVQQILQDEPEDTKWKVEGSANFNALVRLCIKHIKGFCVRYLFSSNNLAVSENKFDQRPLEVKDKCAAKWKKLRGKIRKYMMTLCEFLTSMSSTEAVASVLKHCQKMSGFWALMGSKCFKLLKTLITIWSEGEDSCRILAFMTMMRMTNSNKDVFMLRIFKQMYMAYVTNCKFTSVNTWSSINFMRKSLVEVYLLDTSTAYSIAFPFIRQLAIHLRNAMTAGSTPQPGKHGKKEASKIVYSWQFVHSLHLWADLLAEAGSRSDESIKLLLYPVVQVCLGTIKLIPTKKYIPLRFMVIRMLIKLQEKTGMFIPILPLITEVLLMTSFNAKTVAKFSVRPLDMTCCLKADATESGYTKAVCETVFELMLACCKALATELAFPEVVTPTLMELRSFLKKKCKNPEVAKKFRTLIEKIDANSKYISTKRDKALETGAVSLTDVNSQQILKVQMETTSPHPPILEFANTFFKAHARSQAKLRKQNLETREEKLIPKPSALKSKNTKSKAPLKGSTIFDEDDDDDSEDDFKTKLEVEADPTPSAKGKKKIKRKNLSTSEEEDQPLKKVKKGKLKKKIDIADNSNELQDELVDFELSD